MPQNSEIRIALADDHDLLRKGLQYDKQLVLDALQVVAYYKLGIKDPVTHELISSDTAIAAERVAKLFMAIVAEKELRRAANTTATNIQNLPSNFQREVVAPVTSWQTNGWKYFYRR